jgi:hypothetical protein
MAKGYEIELSSGILLQLVPNDGVRDCSISHGPTRIDIDVGAGSFKVVAPEGTVMASVPGVVRFEAKDLTVGPKGKPGSAGDGPHLMRTCAPCNGQSCCVTNCCGSCGCEWLCD